MIWTAVVLTYRCSGEPRIFDLLFCSFLLPKQHSQNLMLFPNKVAVDKSEWAVKIVNHGSSELSFTVSWSSQNVDRIAVPFTSNKINAPLGMDTKRIASGPFDQQQGPVYTKCQCQRCDDASDTAVTANNGVAPECVASVIAELSQHWLETEWFSCQLLTINIRHLIDSHFLPAPLSHAGCLCTVLTNVFVKMSGLLTLVGPTAPSTRWWRTSSLTTLCRRWLM